MSPQSLSQALSDLNLELLLTIALVLILFFAGMFLGRFSLRRELERIGSGQRDAVANQWWNNFWQGISTELFGAVITTLGFGVILIVFQQYQVIEGEKASLILQMGSPSNQLAVEAFRVARLKDWLHDGTLEGADLRLANLENADLQGANLKNSILWNAHLGGAFLEGATLDGVNLGNGFLSGANLTGASFEGALMFEVQLGYQLFNEVNFRGADLEGLLIDLPLGFTPIDTILPDGTMWDENTDLDRFIDPEHPEFLETVKLINTIRVELGYEPILHNLEP